jgi:hypothetical protein
MPRPLDKLIAILEVHRSCGEMESGVDDGRWVWRVCSCGAQLVWRIPRPTEGSRQSGEHSRGSP